MSKIQPVSLYIDETVADLISPENQQQKDQQQQQQQQQSQQQQETYYPQQFDVVVLASSNNKKSKISLCVLVIVVVNLAVALSLGLLSKSFVSRIDDANHMCSASSSSFSSFSQPPTQTIQTWVYNISNPMEYVNGSNALMVELGPYSWSYQLTRDRISFQDDQISFLQYASITFDGSVSCKDSRVCQSHGGDTELYTANVAYQTALQAGMSEGAMMMSMSCSPKQIANIANKSQSLSWT